MSIDFGASEEQNSRMWFQDKREESRNGKGLVIYVKEFGQRDELEVSGIPKPPFHC